ncbi:MAG: hypothetical protein OXG37_06635 [Actinomycetia bacterium]|nr:hypothetical protein [Actinomycetes bacterium]
MFGVIGLALPSRQAPLLGLGVVALGALSAILEVSGLDIAANFTKFAAVAGAGWWILRFLDHVALVLLVAVLIVPIDLISVALGPTRTIVEEAPGVFNTFSVSFPIPGEVAFSQLGLPDVLFFALFLAAAKKFRLRPGLAWLLMACSFGVLLWRNDHARGVARPRRLRGLAAPVGGLRDREHRPPHRSPRPAVVRPQPAPHL